MKNKSMKHAEAAFEILYLLIGFAAALYMLIKGFNRTDLFGTGMGSSLLIFGVGAFFLVLGDSFHLIPRIGEAFGKPRNVRVIGIGNAITSITITIFYYFFCFAVASEIEGGFPDGTETAVSILAAVRIFICILPINQWTSESPSQKYSIIRNIPLIAIGAIAVVLCFMTDGFFSIGIAVILSFVFYIPVVLFAHKNKKIGILMLPKTAAYIYILIAIAAVKG
jgi:hypothetical protein